MSEAIDKFLDRIAMHAYGSQGYTRAHMFLQDRLARPLEKIDDLRYVANGYDYSVRIFELPAPKEKDRVLMFEDNSGVYVFEDGFCTPMGSDISHEVVKWKEMIK